MNSLKNGRSEGTWKKLFENCRIIVSFVVGLKFLSVNNKSTWSFKLQSTVLLVKNHQSHHTNLNGNLVLFYLLVLKELYSCNVTFTHSHTLVSLMQDPFVVF